MCLLCLDEVEFRPASVLKMEEKHNELMKQMKRKFEETTQRGSHNVYNVWVLVYSVFVHKVFFLQWKCCYKKCWKALPYKVREPVFDR